MTRKRMSLRAIARMKRENRELHARLSVATKREQSTTLTSWSNVGQRVHDEITTARRLGFTVEVYISASDAMVLTAVKRVDA